MRKSAGRVPYGIERARPTRRSSIPACRHEFSRPYIWNRYVARACASSLASAQAVRSCALDLATTWRASMNEPSNRDNDSIDGRSSARRTPRSARTTAIPRIGDELGEAAGGISGVLVGAGIGSAAGPVGTLIGGIAGAIGGWWAGRAVVRGGELADPRGRSVLSRPLRRAAESPGRSRVRRRARRVLSRPDRQPQSELHGARVRRSRAGARERLGGVRRQARIVDDRARLRRRRDSRADVRRLDECGANVRSAEHEATTR